MNLTPSDALNYINTLITQHNQSENSATKQELFHYLNSLKQDEVKFDPTLKAVQEVKEELSSIDQQLKEIFQSCLLKLEKNKGIKRVFSEMEKEQRPTPDLACPQASQYPIQENGLSQEDLNNLRNCIHGVINLLKRTGKMPENECNECFDKLILKSEDKLRDYAEIANKIFELLEGEKEQTRFKLLEIDTRTDASSLRQKHVYNSIYALLTYLDGELLGNNTAQGNNTTLESNTTNETSKKKLRVEESFEDLLFDSPSPNNNDL